MPQNGLLMPPKKPEYANFEPKSVGFRIRNTCLSMLALNTQRHPIKNLTKIHSPAFCPLFAMHFFRIKNLVEL
jgi:hypothetical protein